MPPGDVLGVYDTTAFQLLRMSTTQNCDDSARNLNPIPWSGPHTHVTPRAFSGREANTSIKEAIKPKVLESASALIQ